MRISFENMQKVLYDLFVKYKFSKEKAKLIADVFTESTLDGVSSHGINRVPLFIEHIEKGIININSEAVNSIYFWKTPTELLSEIKRVLRPHGVCLLTYAQKSFISNLPFIGDRFRLYNNQDIKELALSASLEISDMLDINETVKNKYGEEVKRIYTIAKFIKPENNDKTV